MKNSIFLLFTFLVAVLLAGCSSFNIGGSGKIVNPSNTIISESRTVSGFTGIDFSTIGQVTITQGDSESLIIKGSDNIVPLVKTSVSNGVLSIRTDDNITITGVNSENVLTFNITVKNLSELTNSGAGRIIMNSLSTGTLSVNMSGAGQVALNKLSADSLNVTVSGVGDVEVAGEVTSARIDLSGAGGVNAPDLQIKTATVNIPGLGGAKIWVTGRLTGTISGAGSVSYFGSPQTDTKTTGLGTFKSLGNK